MASSHFCFILMKFCRNYYDTCVKSFNNLHGIFSLSKILNPTKPVLLKLHITETRTSVFLWFFQIFNVAFYVTPANDCACAIIGLLTFLGLRLLVLVFGPLISFLPSFHYYHYVSGGVHIRSFRNVNFQEIGMWSPLQLNKYSL